tara:strand:- start:325 stop:531 length:207 start_codon:yes stop_codon:yes gene_type:complete
MNASRKSGVASFTYNGNTYVQAKTKSGMVIYKKAGSKSSKKSRKTSRRTKRKTSKRKSRKKRKSRSRK